MIINKMKTKYKMKNKRKIFKMILDYWILQE